MNKEDLDFWLEHEYPLTIISDRYGGTYSGGAFTAWPVEASAVRESASASDERCAFFWKRYEEPVGRGATAPEAMEELREQLRELAGKAEGGRV